MSDTDALRAMVERVLTFAAMPHMRLREIARDAPTLALAVLSFLAEKADAERDRDEANARAAAQLATIVGVVQRFQPGGSPHPGGPVELVWWIMQSLNTRAEAAEAALALAIEALERISRRTSPGHRTMDEMMRDLTYTSDDVRLILESIRSSVPLVAALREAVDVMRSIPARACGADAESATVKWWNRRYDALSRLQAAGWPVGETK